jgi:D-alanyl-D-alanine carboxypeptidase
VLRLATGSLLAVALTAGSAGAQAAQLSVADRSFVDQTVMRAMASDRLSGVSIAVSGPRGSYERAYGVGNLATGAPLRLSDRVRIARITKSFVATAILELVQRGRLSLSAKLSRWVGGIPDGSRITVRELLAMRSGVYDYASDPAWNRRFNADPLSLFKPSDAVAIIRRNKPLFAPGAKTQYADSNYILLGIIAQKVTGDRSSR